ncbi:MAG: hypothetical protein V4521_02135, partial [Pseudomonadota bacterium]
MSRAQRLAPVSQSQTLALLACGAAGFVFDPGSGRLWRRWPGGASAWAMASDGKSPPSLEDWAVTVYAPGLPDDEPESDVQCDDDDAGTLADALAGAISLAAKLDGMPAGAEL